MLEQKQGQFQNANERALLHSIMSENGLGLHYLDPLHPAVRTVVDVARQIGAKEILDLGAGRGLTSKALASELAVNRIIATEINEPGLKELDQEIALLKLPITTGLYDVTTPLPLEWNSAFDLVVAKDVYPFLDPAGVKALVENAAKALHVDGHFVFSAPSTDSRLYRTTIATADPYYRSLSREVKDFIKTEGDYFCFADQAKVEQLLTPLGFKVLSYSPFGREHGWFSVVAKLITKT